MSILKKLASETALYGLPSIVGRLLNFLLIFLYTGVFSPSTFAAHTEFYAYAAVLMVIIPHGMETAFFNFARKSAETKAVFGTSFLSILLFSSLVLVFGLLFNQNIANFMGYPQHPEYVIYFLFILYFDALTVIPFSALRWEKSAAKFAFLKSLGIAINILLNLLFLLYFPKIFGQASNLIYKPDMGMAYVFLANLLSAGIVCFILLPRALRELRYFDSSLWKSMFIYAAPLILVGLAGIINETFDRAIMHKWLISNNIKEDIGIYGAFYKLSIIITIFIQAFRYAAEPFFFERAKDKDSKEMYAEVMHYFILVCGIIFLATSFFLEPLAQFAIRKVAYFNNPSGIKMVPILLLANIFLGINYNLSIWYKLKEKNHIGAIIAVMGALFTILLLYFLLPKYGIIGGAYTTLIVYALMMVMSYIWGQKHYRVPYNLIKIIGMFVLMGSLYFVDLNMVSHLSNVLLKSTLKVSLISIFVAIGFLAFRKQEKKLNLH